MKDVLLQKAEDLMNEPYLSVCKSTNQNQLDRLNKIEEGLIELNFTQEQLEDMFLEYRAELYYEIYLNKNKQ